MDTTEMRDLEYTLLARAGFFLTFKEHPGYISPHSVRVGLEAGRFAAFLGRPPDFADMVMIAGINHDGGKNDSRLAELRDRPGPLNELEKKFFNSIHTAVGGKMVMEHLGEHYSDHVIWHIAAGATLHHHPFSGGYVNREVWNLLFSNHDMQPYLLGKHIPLTARIIAVVDAFDAMVNETERPYRKDRSISVEEAAEKLVAGAGRTFDPEIVYHYLAWTNNLPRRLSKVWFRLKTAIFMARLRGLDRLRRAR